MRGDDRQQGAMHSYISPEARVPHDHPLRVIRGLVDDVLRELSPRFEGLYARVGRPSIAPEQLLRAQLLQILYTIRSERQLMEQLDYNLLFRWFVGLNMDEPVWDPTVFTKNRSAGAAAAVALGRTLPAPMPGTLAAFVAFVREHQRCGELNGGREGGYVWLACSCGAQIVQPASVPPPLAAPTRWD